MGCGKQGDGLFPTAVNSAWAGKNLIWKYDDYFIKYLLVQNSTLTYPNFGFMIVNVRCQ